MHQLHGRGPLADRRRGGLLGIAQDGADPDVAGDPESNLAASAVSGQPPPAGPQWVRGLAPLEPHALVYDKPLPRCVLRPPIAQERFQQRPDGLVRITLKKAYTDGTVAVDMDPLSLLCRLATSVPPKALPHRPLRGRARGREPVEPRIAPKPPTEEPAAATAEPERPGPTGDRPGPTGGYRPWAELLARSFAVDVLTCPSCQGRMRLLAMVKDPASIARYLAAVGEATELPRRSAGRGPAVLEEPRPPPAGAGRRGGLSPATAAQQTRPK